MLMGKIPLGYNIRNLAVRWRTTLLTALAFTMVIALMVVMLAFVNGMSQLTEQSGQPGNVIVLSDGATDELISNLGYNDSSDVALQPGVLRDEHNHPLASREVYLVVNQPIATKPPVAAASARPRDAERGARDAETLHRETRRRVRRWLRSANRAPANADSCKCAAWRIRPWRLRSTACNSFPADAGSRIRECRNCD